ncbi:MAG: redox-regulated ATPase YchF [Pseudomonadota bacterium]|nr:redox-regulated ATPase YchF [Pseudomonadota bacterium]MEC8977311.1 redox-regulated ATPase YchF [Pseudomonadota bacterium]
MGFKCGIVGLPNVGKSTTFNALTAANIDAQNYPFCTIEPNIGMVEVPDPRLESIAKIASSAKTIPTFMEFVDIAGLVAGASKGEGLGNQFLGHIRGVHAIGHVVRCFQDDNITHVNGKIDPLADIETIETELALADIQTLEKALQKCQKLIKAGNQDAKKDAKNIQIIIDTLSNQSPLQPLLEDEDIQAICANYQLISAKPTFFIANIPEDITKASPYLEQVQSYAKTKQAPIVTISAAIEAELASLDNEERMDYLSSLGMEEPGLNNVIRTGHTMLGLSTFFTAGPKETRAWTIKNHAKAPEAAGVIHTDFEKNFIRAEVIKYQDYIDHKGEQGAKQAGVWHLEGKDYQVEDGDILVIRANA